MRIAFYDTKPYDREVVYEDTHGLRALSGAGRLGREAELVEVPLEAVRPHGFRGGRTKGG